MGESIFIAIFVTACIILIKEFIIPMYKNIKTKEKSEKKVELKMEKENITLEQARDEIINEKIIKVFNIDKNKAVINGIDVYCGNKISFNSLEHGQVKGKFLGVKTSNADGYTEHYFVIDSEDQILSAPIEFIAKDSLMVYGK